MPFFFSLKLLNFSFVFPPVFPLPSGCAFLLSTLSFHASCYLPPCSSCAFFLFNYVPSLPNCVSPFWNNSPINYFSSRFPSHLAIQKQLIPNPLWPPKTADPRVVRKMGNLLPRGSTTGHDLCVKFNSKSILLSQTNYSINKFES